MPVVDGGNRLAGGLGFEPRFLESKSNVLPLDDPPAPASSIPGDFVRLAIAYGGIIYICLSITSD